METSNGLPPRVCLLTGSAGTLGTAIMLALLPRYRVIAVYRNHSPFRTLQHEVDFDPLKMVDGYPYQHIPFSLQADITRENDVARIIDVIYWHFGVVDLLINAAVMYNFGSCLDESFLASAGRQFETNLFAPCAACRQSPKCFLAA